MSISLPLRARTKSVVINPCINRTSAVTPIQRFRSALNLNIHLHMLFLDGVYLIDGGSLAFCRLPPPRTPALEGLTHTISQ